MPPNNTFLETRFQRLLYGLIFVEKGLGVHVQRMLKMSRVYTLAEIISKIFVKKRRDNCGPYLRSWFANLIFIKIYYAITVCTTNTFTFKKC